MKSQGQTLIRILSALVLLPFFLFGVISNKFYILPIFVLIIIFTYLGIKEFADIQRQRLEENKTRLESGVETSYPTLAISAAAGLFVNLFFYLSYLKKNHNYLAPEFLAGFGLDFFPFIFFLIAILFLSFFYQIFFRPLNGASGAVAMTFFPVIYIALPLSLIILLKHDLEIGPQAILFATFSAFMADVGAYFGGVYFGRHKTGFPVSPNKSWEGYFAGLVANTLGLLFINFLFIEFTSRTVFSYGECIILGVALGITGQIGDLAESAIKRDCKVKDSGSSIPGHGGVLDLIDAALINVPLLVCYLYLFKDTKIFI